MSDAREIVQPRWKRRATEIAEAIGGGNPSVTVELLSDAIATALQTVTLNVNINQFDGNSITANGIPVNVSDTIDFSNHPGALGGVTPRTIPVDIEQYANDPVSSKGLPVQAGRTAGTNALVPLVVNCQTTNNFPTGTGGTVTFPTIMDVNVKRFGGGPNISASQNLPVAINGNSGPVSVTQHTGSSSDAWIVKTGTSTTAFGLTTVNTTGGATLPSTMAITLPVDANNNTLPLAVSVDNHPTSTTITGNVSVTETSPVIPVTGTIMTKNYPAGITAAQLSYLDPNSSSYFPQYAGNIESQYLAEGFGHNGIIANQPIPTGQSIGAITGTTTHITWSAGMTAPWSSGWTIQINGTDIKNQDITFGIVNNGLNPPNNRFIEVDSQATIDQHHGRKVTLSSVSNVWIIEPVDTTALDTAKGIDVSLANKSVITDFPNDLRYGKVIWHNPGSNQYEITIDAGGLPKDLVTGVTRTYGHVKDSITAGWSSSSSMVLRRVTMTHDTTGYYWLVVT